MLSHLLHQLNNLKKLSEFSKVDKRKLIEFI